MIETERLTLRRILPGDLDPFTAFFTSARGAFVGGGADVDAGRAFRSLAAIDGHWTLRGVGILVMEARETGRPVGAVGPWFPTLWPEPEIGWTIWDPKAEGKGYAFEGARAMLAHVFRGLGWETAVSYIDPANARSAALAKRLGARIDAGATPPPDMPCDVWRHDRGAFL
ncbi:MAG: GNAT family N-acetyltransferase [Pseudomonadota bacterium]